MAVARLFGIRQINNPVMGKIDRFPLHTPLLRIELGGVRALIMDRGRFGKIVEVLRSAAKVFLRRGSIAESKQPAVIQQNTFADGLGGKRKSDSKKE